MTYRSEIKHMINAGDKAAICANLRAVAHLDPHAGERGYYQIRSLYFDNIADKALREKIDGVSEREKFRIRYYDGNTSVIHLEKKKSSAADWATRYPRPFLPRRLSA